MLPDLVDLQGGPPDQFDDDGHKPKGLVANNNNSTDLGHRQHPHGEGR